MNENKSKGFTLIEILVVVLIIGILAAISVVQYQKSVLKSRFTALMPIAKALYEGNELFAMSSGKYTDKLENLDISTTGGVSGSTANINGSIVTLGVNNRHTYVKATRENFDNNLIMFQKGSKYFPGEIHCEAKEGKTLANWLCKKELGGEKLDRSLTEGYTDYVIKGDGNGFFPKDWVDSVKQKEFMPGDTCTAKENSKCSSDLKFNNNTCYAEAESGCYFGTYTNSTCVGNHDVSCNSSTYINSECEGNKKNTCIVSTYKDNSVCQGDGENACNGSGFTDSTCIANGEGSCSARADARSNDYIDSKCIGNNKGCIGVNFLNSSVCEGNHSQACVGSTFSGNSICYANEEGACGDYTKKDGTITPSTYEGNACCKGTYCPANAPKCDCGIDANTGQHALSC